MKLVMVFGMVFGALAALVVVATACTTTNEANVDCVALTDATIGSMSWDESCTACAIPEWFADEAAATAKWGHIRDW
jgi:hypothetical protein